MWPSKRQGESADRAPRTATGAAAATKEAEEGYTGEARNLGNVSHSQNKTADTWPPRINSEIRESSVRV